MNKIYFAFIVLVGFSCAKNPAKTLNKLMKENKNLFNSDTVYEKDTIFSPSISKDTTFFSSKDTIFLIKEKMSIKYFFNSITGINYLQGKCDSDTIFVEKKIINNWVNYFEVQKNIIFSFIKKWLIIYVIIAVCLLIYVFLRKPFIF